MKRVPLESEHTEETALPSPLKRRWQSSGERGARIGEILTLGTRDGTIGNQSVGMDEINGVRLGIGTEVAEDVVNAARFQKKFDGSEVGKQLIVVFFD